MIYLLDTDTCISILRKRQRVIDRLSQLSPQDCAVSMITVFELLCGLGRAADPARERKKIDELLSVISTLTFDYTVADRTAKIRIDLERKGTLIGPYDLLIGAQALANDLILVTGNVGEFSRVADLRLETWE
jgi:tRNA(fMet)-specific endonuclease VapC